MHKQKYRKALSVISTAAMLSLTMGTGVFAATTNPNNTGYSTVGFSDVTSATPGSQSIIELGALGIVNGFGAATGGAPSTFGPATNLTRAEFAKMLDLALNQGSSASLMSGTSQFKDVPTSQWFTGYVNAAAASGIVEGYGDGNFGPNDNVTNAEAITMAVRALGYEPNVTGPWPTGYIAEASRIPNYAKVDALLNGLVGTDPGAPMTRSDAAVILDNMLYSQLASSQYASTIGGTTVTNPAGTTEVLLQADGYQFSAPGQTQFGAPTSNNGSANVVLNTQLNAGINPNQVGVGLLGTSPGNATVASTVGISGGNSINDLLGDQVSTVSDQSGNFLFMASVSPANDVLTNATLNSAITAGTLPTSVSITPNGGTNASNYTAATGAQAYGNGSMAAGDSVNVVLNPAGQIVSIMDTKNPPGASSANTDSVLVSIDTSGNPATMQIYAAGALETLNLSATAQVTLDGSASSLGALKANDIVTLLTSGGYVTSIQASDQTVTGTLTNTSVSAGSTTFEVNGTTYTLASQAQSVNNGGSPSSPSDPSGMLNQSVTASMGPDGKVALLTTTTGTTVTGLVLSATPNYIQIQPSTGANVTATTPSPQPANGDIVKISTNTSTGTTKVTDYESTLTNNVVFGTLGDEMVAANEGTTDLGSASVSANQATLTFGSAIGTALPIGTELYISDGNVSEVATVKTAALATDTTVNLVSGVETTHAAKDVRIAAITDYYVPSSTTVFAPANNGATYNTGNAAAVETFSSIEPGNVVNLGIDQNNGNQVEGILVLNTGINASVGPVSNADAAVTSINVPPTGTNATINGVTLGGVSVTLSGENNTNTAPTLETTDWGDWSQYVGNLNSYGGSGTASYGAAPLAIPGLLGSLVTIGDPGTAGSPAANQGLTAQSATTSTGVEKGVQATNVGAVTNHTIDANGVNIGTPSTITIGGNAYVIDAGTVIYNNMNGTLMSPSSLQPGDTVSLVYETVTPPGGSAQKMVLYMYVLANPTGTVTASTTPGFSNVSTTPGGSGNINDFLVNATLLNGSLAPISNASVALALTLGTNTSNYSGQTIFTGTTDGSGNVSISVYLGTGTTVGGSTATLQYGSTTTNVTLP